MNRTYMLHTELMIIVILGYVRTYREDRDGRCWRQGSPLRVRIVIDSLFTKNMHNEFIMAYRDCYEASPLCAHTSLVLSVSSYMWRQSKNINPNYTQLGVHIENFNQVLKIFLYMTYSRLSTKECMWMLGEIMLNCATDVFPRLNAASVCVSI